MTAGKAIPCFVLLAAGCAAAEVHTFVPKAYYRSFSAQHEPALRIKPGDTVVTKALDASGRDEKGVSHAEFGNPLTGPFYVAGAEPGDAVAVTLKRVRLNRNWGWTNYRLGTFALLRPAIPGLYPNRYKEDLVFPGRANLVPWDIDPAANTVRLREPVSGRLKMEFAARPMLGCLGVAAAGETAPDSGTGGVHGGNMDYNRVGEGATVLFPVSHPGALLYLGDGHALQGDGEPTGTGVETSMDVEFTVELHKAAKLSGPRLITPEYVISVGSQPEFSSNLDRALEMATTDMTRWLAESYGLEPWAAHLLIGTQARYEVVTVAGSMALCIPRRYLPAPR